MLGKEKKSGQEKVVAVLATVFLVSLGLCGVNFVAVMSSNGSGAGAWLGITAYIELFGMVLSGGGLLFIAIIAIASAIIDSLSNRGSKPVSIIERDIQKEEIVEKDREEK